MFTIETVLITSMITAVVFGTIFYLLGKNRGKAEQFEYDSETIKATNDLFLKYNRLYYHIKDEVRKSNRAVARFSRRNQSLNTKIARLEARYVAKNAKPEANTEAKVSQEVKSISSSAM